MATIASVSKKRKRDEEKVLLGEPFIIQPHTSSVFESAIKITPAVVFPRKCVPPSWLSGMPPRLFSASIPALDAPGYVLITKTEGERPLSAVEKISEGVFTLCKLSANVKMGEVRRLAQIVRKPTLPAPEYVHPSKICPEKDWWTQILLDGFDLDAAGAGGGNSVVLSMMHPKTQPAQDVRLLSPPAEIVEFREPTPAEILGQVLSQYLEALYVAKTSIAYFTKSTLSRARVKFQQEVTPGVGTSPQGIDQLVEYLQGMLLPLDKMDVKYKKTVIQIATEDTIEDGTMLKNGEEEYVHRWVKVNFNDKIIQHNDPLLKRQIDELKIREYVV
ncbi:DNA replication regulator SLD3-domain-containing protein [Peziza echinospora]|nr:DNA replication regulator SLD3-domain-containing protein [Peziza echinospora]